MKKGLNINMSPIEVARITKMLQYRRRANSDTEWAFITEYIDSIPGVYADGYGNRLLVCPVGTPGADVMISCHTDTVHRQKGMQQVQVSRDGVVSLSKQELVSNCLGADCTAGVYAAIRMIEAGVRATYVFHRDEESGGTGSAWLAEKYPDWISSFRICLALDRRGCSDIITYQNWGNCASKEFAVSLAAELGMAHKSADGIFTDSASYMELIPECSNLSIGYQNEHTTRETLDLNYLETVIQALTRVNWGNVVSARVPEPEPVWPAWGLADTIEDEENAYQELRDWYRKYEAGIN